jgi:hypothetical protein
MKNQMLVVEQFEDLPILLFTARYNEVIANFGGNRWMSVTQSIQKSNGLWAYDRASNTNGAPYFSALLVDAKSRTINLVGMSGSVQHYVDEGKGPPAFPVGRNGLFGEPNGLYGLPNPYLQYLPNPYNPAGGGAILPPGNGGFAGVPQGGFRGGAIVLPPGGIPALPLQEVPARKK